MIEPTHLDDLVEFPQKVIRALAMQENIRELLSDRKGATIEDMEDQHGHWLHFFDYDFIPGTQQEVISAVCVDIDLFPIEGTMMQADLYISIMCSKSLMDISSRNLPGYVGNRVSNLVRYIDLVLRGRRDFGIGRLQMPTVRTVASGNQNICKKEIRYAIPDFRVDRSLLQ